MRDELAGVLGLQPLDRLQLNDQHQIAEMAVGRRMGQQCDLPFLFFQRVLPSGLLEVRSPGGYVTAASPEDICDLRRGAPVIVRAMPEAQFRNRLRLPVQERQKRPLDECYAPAHVLYVVRNRWGQVDQVAVWFLEAVHNSGKPFMAPIHDDDLALVREKATRAHMPVMSATLKAPASAEKGLKLEREQAERLVRGFLKAGRSGNASAVSRLAMAGAEPIRMRAVMDLCGPLL
jgi:hypothetical protein